jgi:hypothetical protein
MVVDFLKNLRGERINKKLNNSSSLRPRAELVVAVYPFSLRKTKGASVVLVTSQYHIMSYSSYSPRHNSSKSRTDTSYVNGS